MQYIHPNGLHHHTSHASSFAPGAMLPSSNSGGGAAGVLPPLPSPHLSVSPTQPSYMHDINGGFQAVKIKEEIPDELDSG